MKSRLAFLFNMPRRRWLAAALLGLAGTGCQPQPRFEQLEAVQREQARELAQLRQELAERDEEVTQLQACVNDLENSVYEADSAEYDDGPQLLRL